MRTAHFGAVAGRDEFKDVKAVFVIDRPLASPQALRDMALALTGLPVAEQQPHKETRGVLMADGTGAPMDMWVYEDQTLEALRASITDAAHVHPHDLGRVRAAFAATRPLLGAYDIDFRILVGDEIRWIAARGQGDDNGIVGRTMFGVFLDVTQRKQAEEAHELLAGEMSHRVKNLLHVAAGLVPIDLSADLIDGLGDPGIAGQCGEPPSLVT